MCIFSYQNIVDIQDSIVYFHFKAYPLILGHLLYASINFCAK